MSDDFYDDFISKFSKKKKNTSSGLSEHMDNVISSAQKNDYNNYEFGKTDVTVSGVTNAYQNYLAGSFDWGAYSSQFNSLPKTASPDYIQGLSDEQKKNTIPKSTRKANAQFSFSDEEPMRYDSLSPLYNSDDIIQGGQWTDQDRKNARTVIAGIPKGFIEMAGNTANFIAGLGIGLANLGDAYGIRGVENMFKMDDMYPTDTLNVGARTYADTVAVSNESMGQAKRNFNILTDAILGTNPNQNTMAQKYREEQREDYDKSIEKIDRWSGFNDADQMAQKAGNLLGSASSTAASLLGGVGFFVIFASQTDRNAQTKLAEARANGVEITQEVKDNIMLYSVGSAAVEAASERIFTIGAGKAANIAKEVLEKPMKDFGLHMVKFLIRNGLEEGAEEVVSGLGEGIIAQFTTDKDATFFSIADTSANISVRGLAEQFAGGFLMGALFSTVSTKSEYKNFTNSRAFYESKVVVDGELVQVKDIPVDKLTKEIQEKGVEAVMKDLANPANVKIAQKKVVETTNEAAVNAPISEQIEVRQKSLMRLYSPNVISHILSSEQEANYKQITRTFEQDIARLRKVKENMDDLGVTHTIDQLERLVPQTQNRISSLETAMNSVAENKTIAAEYQDSINKAKRNLDFLNGEVEIYKQAYEKATGKAFDKIAMPTKTTETTPVMTSAETIAQQTMPVEGSTGGVKPLAQKTATEPTQRVIRTAMPQGAAQGTATNAPVTATGQKFSVRAKAAATKSESTIPTSSRPESVRAVKKPLSEKDAEAQDGVRRNVISKIQSMKDMLTGETITEQQKIKMKLQMFALKQELSKLSEVAQGRRVHGFIDTLTRILDGGSVAEIRKLFEDSVGDLTYEQLGNAKQIEISDKLFASPDAETKIENLRKYFYENPNAILEPNQVISLTKYFKELTKSSDSTQINVGIQGFSDLSDRMTMGGQMGQSARAVIDVFGGYRHGMSVVENFENLAIDKIDENAVDMATKKTKKEIANILAVSIKNSLVPFEAKENIADKIFQKVLFQKYLEENPSRRGEKTDAFRELVIMALNINKSGAWDAAKPIVIEKIRQENVRRVARGQEIIKVPQNYLDQPRDPIFTKRLMNQAMRKVFEYNDTTLEIETRKFFLEGGISQRTIDRFVDTLRYKFEETYGQKMPDETFEYIQEHFTNHFKKSMEDVRGKLRLAMEKQVKETPTVKIIARKTKIEKTIEQLTDAVISGAFSDDTLNMIWAKRLGVNYLTEEMRSEIVQSVMKIDDIENEDERFEAFNDFMANLANKTEASNMRKFNAWRRFAMLCSPKTWTRNGISNYAYVPYAAIADRLTNRIQKILKLEASAQIYGKKYIRRGDNADIDAATDEYLPDSKIRVIVGSSTKYELKNQLREDGRTFKANWIENLTRGPLNMITTGGWTKNSKYKIGFFGDAGILSVHLRSAFRNKLNALGYNASLDTAKRLDMEAKALEHAKNVALTRTYRTSGVISDLILSLKTNTNTTSKINEYVKQAKLEQDRGDFVAANGYLARAKTLRTQLNALSAAVDIAVPFVVTPIAIAVEAYRFSPVAVLQSVGELVVMAKRGEINAENSQKTAQVTARLSQALVGTAGQWVLGAVLALAGCITGAPPTNEKEKKEWALEGKTPYSIYIPNFGWLSYSWCQPVALGIMAGADVGLAIKDGEYDIKSLPGAITAGLDGMFGLTLYENISNLWKGKTLSQNIFNLATSGLYQLFPTVAKQLAQTIDPYVRNTYSGSTLEVLYQRAISYIPGLSMTQPIKIDIWGNPVEGQDAGFGILGRSILNLLSPFTIATPQDDRVSNEVIELFNKTHDTACLPVVVRSKWDKKVDGKTYSFDLSGEDYVEYQSLMGKYSYKYVRALMKEDEYKDASDKEKVAMLTRAYREASSDAKLKYIEEHG